MEEPLVYREVLSRGRRTFELFSEHIVVHTKYPNHSADITVLLSDLRHSPNTVWIREWPFKAGLGVMAIAAANLGYRSIQATPEAPVDWESVLTFSVPFLICGGVMCLYCIRKIEFACFVNHVGINALDIADAGPDRAEFRGFVDQLNARIQSSQKTK
jgi:hypothetical protein